MSDKGIVIGGLWGNEPLDTAVRHDVRAAASLLQMPGEELRALLRRDWAVRVLDAFETLGGKVVWVPGLANPTIRLTWRGLDATRVVNGLTRDAARHAAALAVWPTLSDEEKAQIGECP